jgi:hypothetical protein
MWKNDVYNLASQAGIGFGQKRAVFPISLQKKMAEILFFSVQHWEG